MDESLPVFCAYDGRYFVRALTAMRYERATSASLASATITGLVDADTGA